MTQYVDFKIRGENILDLVLSNSHIVSNVRPSLPFADHTSISFSLGIPSPPPREFIPSRLYHLADWNSINYHISSHDWTLALLFFDVDNAFSYFTEVVNSLLDAFVPKSTPSPFSHYPRHLKILYGKSKRATLTKRFERALRAHQVKIESRIVESKNPKAFFSLCNTRLKACQSAPPGIIDVDGTQLLSCRDKASAFSKYFASVSTSPLQSPLPSHSPPLNTPLFDLPYPHLYNRAFTTFIRPLLEYGSVVWSPHTVILANQIEEHRRFISDILFLYKSIHGFYSYDHSNLFRKAPLTRSLRRSHNLRISLPFVPPKSHSSFVIRVIERWNVLDAEIVTSSPHIFRSHILSIPSISFSEESLLRL
ncbi:hypothetical protein PENTCL1PPCAC_1443 [Pristionchus entomophagus]|uniref:Endonuclease/exonuclease/phosphatase domain-containing protein n=1 Tax=Pristionchus entomophagus TaxID=358040 RepID=A0AAV5SAX7_9BILA|nr:hypothetical protein PENTCL1PPCAC_1443 [Pristionchus entomophagus]